MKKDNKYIVIKTDKLHHIYTLLDKRGVTGQELGVFKILFQHFIPMIHSYYFKSARVGDGKYELFIIKDVVTDVYTVKYTINNYGNKINIWI